MSEQQKLVEVLKDLGSVFTEASPLGKDIRTGAVALENIDAEKFSAHVDAEKLAGFIAQYAQDADSSAVDGASGSGPSIGEVPAAAEEPEVPSASEPSEEPTQPEAETNVEEQKTEESKNQEEDDMSLKDLPSDQEAAEIIKKYASGDKHWSAEASDVVISALFPERAKIDHAPARPDEVKSAELPATQMPNGAASHDTGIVDASKSPVKTAGEEETPAGGESSAETGEGETTEEVAPAVKKASAVSENDELLALFRK